EDKNAPEWNESSRQEMHAAGLTQFQADHVTKWWNGVVSGMVKAHNDAIQAESVAAEKKLRSEMGDKYDTNVELAKRLWQKHGEGDFDKAFENASGVVRFGTIRTLLKFAALTGEDASPQGSTRATKATDAAGFDYSKSPKPPTK
ncbi:hypothetical protein OEZ78_26435, partial [Leclercia adecarboxylata]|uniref:hypothetical protein n=1 Tax=Leclercia adecarboxylata TaxID=83655 RepID=UPI00234DA6E1